MTTNAPQRPELSTKEWRNCAVDFAGKLDAGETLTGAPQVDEIGTTVMEITSKTVNTETIEVNGRTVPPGEAVQFRAKAPTGKPGTTLQVLVVASTTAGQDVDTGCVMQVT